MIKQTGGSATSATIQVTAFGRTDTYQNVTAVYGDWTGQSGCGPDPSGDGSNTCQDTIIVDPSVLVPMTIIGSPGDDVDRVRGQQQQHRPEGRRRQQPDLRHRARRT